MGSERKYEERSSFNSLNCLTIYFHCPNTSTNNVYGKDDGRRHSEYDGNNDEEVDFDDYPNDFYWYDYDGNGGLNEFDVDYMCNADYIYEDKRDEENCKKAYEWIERTYDYETEED